MTGCLRWHPGPLSWNSLLTQVLGSGGREKRKLGRQAGRAEEGEEKAGSWAAVRGRERRKEGRNGGMEQKEESGTVGPISFSQLRD